MSKRDCSSVLLDKYRKTIYVLKHHLTTLVLRNDASDIVVVEVSHSLLMHISIF